MTLYLFMFIYFFTFIFIFLFFLFYLFYLFFFCLCKKSQNARFIGRQILFGAFMAKDSRHGVIFPAYQVVVMPECFTKSIPADGLELTHTTSGARHP